MSKPTDVDEFLRGIETQRMRELRYQCPTLEDAYRALLIQMDAVRTLKTKVNDYDLKFEILRQNHRKQIAAYEDKVRSMRLSSLIKRAAAAIVAS